MAYRPNPNDPFITPPPTDDIPRGTDPMMPSDRFEESGPISGTRVALYAVAVLALVGALFYGMSTTTNENTASNAPTTGTAQSDRPNTGPGVTTGATPSQPAPAAPADATKQ